MRPATPSAVVYLGLGSNLGDRLGLLRRAVHALDRHPEIEVDRPRGVARLYETKPFGVAEDQPAYLNSAVRIQTVLEPRRLLEATLAIEKALGRRRYVAGEPRVIDVDILLYGDIVVHDSDLIIPHPRMHERWFVLEPMCDIAADVVHPVLKVTLNTLRTNVLATTPSGCEVRRYGEGLWCVGGVAGSSVTEELDFQEKADVPFSRSR